MADNSGESKERQEFKYMGKLEGHKDWVTSIVAGTPTQENQDSSLIISSSRDKSILIWKLYNEEKDGYYGIPFKGLTGHNHFVTDLSISNDNSFLLSSSWDKTIRLWDLRVGKTSKMFTGHKKEIFTVSFSPDNRQIISAGADEGIYLWNTLAEHKFTTDKFNHTDWVSSIKYSPMQKTSQKNPIQPYFASVGWDGKLKIWNTNFQIRYTFKAHEDNINTVHISPNIKYIATGGKDKIIRVWDITDLSQPHRELNAGSQINQLAFNNKLQWLAAATEDGVKIWDLMSDSDECLDELTHESTSKDEKSKKTKLSPCKTITWNSLGKKIFAGFGDGVIKVWHIVNEEKK